MNKKLLPLLILALVVLGALGYYFMNSKNGTDTGAPTAQNETTDGTTGEGSMKMSFLELLKLGKNYSCTFDTTDEAGNRTEGTVYVADAGNRLKGDFNYQQPDTDPYDMHIIRDGEYNYFWSSLQEQGFKYKIDPETESLFPSQDKDDDTTSQAPDENQPVDFDCENWVVNASLFVPPTDIEFLDTGAMMQNFMQSAESEDGAPSIDCSACDQAPEGASRDQCRQALGC